MIRILRIAVLGLFVVATVFSGVLFIKDKVTTDTTIPKITIEEEVLEVALNAKNGDLLKGVTAADEKDGDLTDKVIIESISKFIEKGVCKVTYAVCDNDNNVATAVRKVRYKGYKSPEFKMTGSPCYSLYEYIDLFDIISAKDCIDGDITKDIVITSKDFAGSTAGVFNIEATVTNSKGDTSNLKFPMVVEDRTPGAPVIELKNYLVYTSVNKKIDFKQYLLKATDNHDTDLTQAVRIETNVDFSKEGTYSVHYYVTDEAGSQGHTMLIVTVGK
ncbi:MAG: DUF5011 domain-containing protein [Clostridia bacterium]|jgi:hypothetical protein|nr:DUF5011 domain-containing protein [Clostridia bacterium]